MAIDTLVTDVGTDAYFVVEHPLGISFVPCEYEHLTKAVVFDPRRQITIHTSRCYLPLAAHETEIRKLISVNLKIMVPAPESNYQTN